MATESAVTIAGSHPFSTGEDTCLVHNGSLSNHNRLRETLTRHGERFQTENDSEVAAAYLTWRMREGDSLKEALERSLDDLDGFYTFVVGTRDGFAVLRDPDRLQAGRDGRDRRLGRLRHRVSRARHAAGHRHGAHLGAGAGDRLCLEPGSDWRASPPPPRPHAPRCSATRCSTSRACRCGRSTSCCTMPTAATF